MLTISPTLAGAASRGRVGKRHLKHWPSRWWVSGDAGDAIINFIRPRSSFGVIYRHYRHPQRSVAGRRLLRLCSAKGVPVLWGWRPGLPPPPGSAWGVHLPSGVRPPAWLNKRRFSIAVHCRRQLRRAFAFKATAVLLSPVFPTETHENAAPLGRYRTLALIRPNQATYALGGITAKTARGLVGLPLSGLAMHSFYVGSSA